jgi:NAD(P)-dependent dehydrogenase (short-subunit alcohol dehydrogenase family)
MKTVLITGGAKSVGRAISDRLWGRGCTIISVGRGPENDIRRDLTEVRTDEDAKSIFEEACGMLGPYPDILINNAGMTKVNWLEDQKVVEDWDPVISLNLSAPYVLSRHLAERAANVGGTEDMYRVVNVCSMAIRSLPRCSTAYTCSKAALEMLTRAMARECAGRLPITFYSASPGIISDTPMVNSVLKDLESKRGMSEQEALQYTSTRTVNGRMSTMDEVANLVTYLALDAPTYCSGGHFEMPGGGMS